jgi:hypothetical protein
MNLRRCLSSCLFLLIAVLFGSGAHASTVQLPQTTYTVNENAGRVDIAVSVTRNTSLGNNEVIQVDYDTTDGTARAGIDYTRTAGTLTFTAGVQSLTVSVPIINRTGDNGYPGDTGTFAFRISSPRSNASPQPTISGSDTATVNIVDLDANKIGFTSSEYQVDEPAVGAARVVRLVVRRFGQPNQGPQTVQFQTENGTAVAGTDYFARSGTLTFDDNTTTQNIDITVLSDGAAAGNKTFFVRLTPGSGNPRLGISRAAVTILDRETSTVRLSSATYSVRETGGRVVVSVVRNGNLSISGAVNVSTSNGSAVEGRNYVGISQDVTFAPGESAKNVEIQIINDPAVTGTLDFNVNLALRSSNPAFLLGQPATARVSIIDAAPANTVEFVEADQPVARGTGPAKVIVRLNRAPGNDEAVTVQFATANASNPQQTAIPDVDYTPVSGTLTFGVGVTLRVIDVPILDAQTSDTRRLVVNLSNPSPNASLGVSTALVTILPANSAGQIQFSAQQYQVFENNGTVTLTVLLNRVGDTTRTVAVDYATRPGSAGTNRFVPTSGRLTFASGSSVATLSVSVINDSIVQPEPQNFFVTLSNPQNASLGEVTEASVLILDDDGLNRVEFDAADYGAVETDGSVSLRIVAIRGSDPNQQLEVRVELQDGTALLGRDYDLPEEQIVVFPAGTTSRRISIPVINRLGPQSSRIFTAKLQLTDQSQFTTIGRQGQARVTILDDSGPNTVQFLTSAQRFREGSQAAVAITAVRYGDFNRNGTQLTFTTEVRQGDTAVPGVNFTPTSGTVTFDPILGTIGNPPRVVVIGNETRKTILIPIPENNLVQGDLTFHVTITGSDVAQFGEIPRTQITIEDNDVGNVVQFTSPTYTASKASGSALITVALTPNGDASRASTVNYAATGITAFPGFHFSPVSGTLVFAPGETIKTFTVPINPDAVASGDLTFRVTLSSPSEGTVIGATSTAIVTIDNSVSNVQFSASNYDVENRTGFADITVNLSRASGVTAPLTVNFETFDISAVAGQDYTATAGTLTFSGNERSKTIRVPLTPQAAGQPTRQFEIRLSNPTPMLILGAISRATVTISNVIPPPQPDLSTKLANISTRGPVQQGDSVMIAGFIVQGDVPKQLVVRGIGPSLAQFGVTGALNDPTLQLMDANGNQIAFNDDFGSNNADALGSLSTSGMTPSNPRESALAVSLAPGTYTAILRGKANGVGLIEVFDVNRTASSRLVNLSTRAKVEQNDSGTVIAGFIMGPPSGQPGTAQRVAVRVIAPSLSRFGVSGVLADPTLELYRGSERIFINDNWKTQSGAGLATRSEIEAAGFAPTDDRESVILTTLDPGTYSAVVRGRNNTTGVALVEVFRLQ